LNDQNPAAAQPDFFVVRLSSDSASVRCAHRFASENRAKQSCNHSNTGTFILHSANKIGGTDERREHRAIPFVVGAGNADT
jgi:hypothetical protein